MIQQGMTEKEVESILFQPDEIRMLEDGDKEKVWIGRKGIIRISFLEGNVSMRAWSPKWNFLYRLRDWLGW
jgi:hypothetical protein